MKQRSSCYCRTRGNEIRQNREEHVEEQGEEPEMEDKMLSLEDNNHDIDIDID